MLLNVKKTKKHITIFAVAAVVAITSIGTTVSALAAENTLQLEGGSNITVVSENGSAISYNQEGDVVQANPKDSYVPHELSYEEIMERIKLHEEKGIPVPQAYLDAVK